MLRFFQRIRRQWRAALQAGSLVLLVAVAPTLGFIGHWGEFTDYAIGRTGHEAPAHIDHVDHSAHCHGNASCSEQQQPIGARLFPAVVEVAQPSFIDHAVEDNMIVYSEFFLIPPTEPPQL